VRGNDEFRKIVRHIEWNPVSAGLADFMEEWPWSRAALAGESACPSVPSMG
jgi:hypothetical protein